MDLEEMKNTWTQLSSEMENQKKLTNEIILKMAHQKSSKSVSNLKWIESLGGFIMGIPLVLSTLYFILMGEFESIPLIIFAVLSVSIFSYASWYSFDFFKKLLKINLMENSLKDSQIYFKEFKETFKRNKKFGMITTLPVMILYIPVVLKIFNDIDIFTNFSEGKTELFAILISCFALAVPVLFLVFRYYKVNIKATEEAHEEIEKQ